MAERSAGILLFRHRDQVEVFLVHPGGPFWAKKDEGAWSIPKGIIGEDEDSLAAAKREFFEEVGIEVDGTFESLGSFRQPSGKIVSAWALESNIDPGQLKSNLFEME